MAAIRATCPGCGNVDLPADDLLLRIRPSHDRNTYCFSCPRCGSFVEKPADAGIIRLLLWGGVEPTFLSGPAEVLEAHEGPPITPDDLLTFHEQLESADLAGPLGLSCELRHT